MTTSRRDAVLTYVIAVGVLLCTVAAGISAASPA